MSSSTSRVGKRQLELQETGTAPEVMQHTTTNTDHIRMESVARISKLPVVEETLNSASNIYVKVKNCNSFFNWSFDKAESTVVKAVDSTVPVQKCIQRPVETMDNLLCSGLDYVEQKVPAIKMPPHEMYECTVQCVKQTVQPCVETTVSIKNYGFEKIGQLKNSVFGKPASPDPNVGAEVVEEPNGDGSKKKEHQTLHSQEHIASGEVHG